jgi:hypothetical protein
VELCPLCQGILLATRRIEFSLAFFWRLKLGYGRKQGAILPARKDPDGAKIFGIRDQEPLGVLNSSERFRLDLYESRTD